MKRLAFLFMLFYCLFFQQAKAQNWGNIGSQIGETIALKLILDNPNLQSADMKNYIAFVNAGDRCYNAADYGSAISHYVEASKIASGTGDANLKKLYYNYGWKNQLNESYNNAYTQYKLQNPSQLPETSSSGGAVPVYTGDATTTTTTTTAPTQHTCRLCSGTGMKIKEYYGSGQRKWCATCNKEVSTGHMHVTCDLCNGKGYQEY